MIQKIFYVIGTIFCTAWLGKNVAMPVIGYTYFKDDYRNLTSKCANAMDESWFLEQQHDPVLNKTAQVHLLACHEYDKIRKRMISFGVTENMLAYIELGALEIDQHSIERFIEHHRFPGR